ncbi:hypothetical protein BCR36DRAFT_346015 [Piromyces finnis]|uniref:Uncharacterized protein n=1 Tax=Piromyces finnis TaxID=1754191 RepID=A0A1Y1VJ23_9FUNG|nr:hypothetical protein BCR36DRAFT_346015 [Piromyces finnis]|eukprot:ORX56658.1 hypothetical protein BCR36DRAFT_346015 [Piromyces finnis]
MITFYESNPQNQMKYHQRKPDELSFLSDDEDEIVNYDKNKRMSQITATDSAYFSESSNQATTIISPKDTAIPSLHHNVIIWQKQQQQYQKQNDSVSSPSSTPTPSFDNGNDMISISQLETIPHIDNWDIHSSDDNSVNKSKYTHSYHKGAQELSYNSPEQRTQRIQLRMSQWKEKLELMSASSAVSSSSSVVGYSPNSSPNPAYKRGRGSRHASFSSTFDIDNNIDVSYARSLYSINSLPNSIFDEKYDSFIDDDHDSIFSMRSSNFHPNTNSYIPPRSKSSLEVRHPNRSSRLYNSGSISPLKESRTHIMQAELENSQRIYKQKLQQINQIKQDLEQYQYKLEKVRENEIEQAKKQAIEELELTVIKNLKLEIESLQNKLSETTRELEHSKAYSDMLRNELITLKMNEQSFTFDRNDDEDSEEEKTKVESPLIIMNEIKSKDISTSDSINEQQMPKNSSDELQRLAMLEKELKKKNEEIIELKKKLDKSTKLNDLSKREIDLLNRKVENHRQAREEIENRHTKLVDVASANEIELNKLRYKLNVLTQRQDKALKKIHRRYSSILEVDEEEIADVKSNLEISTVSINGNDKKSNFEMSQKEVDKEELSNTKLLKNDVKERTMLSEVNPSTEVSTTLEQISLLDDTLNDILDLSELDSLSESSNVNSENLDDILNELNLSDLDLDEDEDEDFNLDDISFDDETVLI